MARSDGDGMTGGKIGIVEVDAMAAMKDLYVIVKAKNIRQAYIRVRIARILFDLGKFIGGYSAVTYARDHSSE